MDLPAPILFGLVNLVLGAALAVLRKRPAARTVPGWAEALLLFFLATVVCDGLAAVGLGLALAPNAYALAAGFLLTDTLLAARRKQAA